MKLKNDVFFNINNRIIVFCEHQSTLNGNMPLRDLLYIAKTYENMVPVKSRYRKAITCCIEHHILEEYLSRKGSDVLNFLCAEYDYEMDLQVKGEESYEKGYKNGLRNGIDAIIVDNISQGILKEEITEKLMKYFSMTEKEAKDAIEKYLEEKETKLK